MSSTTPTHLSIRKRARAAGYTEQALQAIVQIAEANDPPSLLEKLVGATAAIGASASLYTAAVPDGDHEQTCFSLFAGHPAYAHAQNALGPLNTHPWFRFARSHSTSGSDRRIPIAEAADAAAVELARRYGFRACFIVPTPANHDLDRFGMLCLGSEEADDFEGQEAGIARTLARSLAAELHDWLSRYLQQRLRETAKLETTDVKLLAMEWKGLKTKEIAHLTGLSPASVDSRFQRINTRLNCTNRRASAIRAAAYGLLEST